MVKYIHIGYPKNFSTSLQRNLFSIHPDIYHLGIGIGSNIAYRDDLTSSLFEVYLKSAKKFKWDEVKSRLQAHVNFHLKTCVEQGKKAFGASSEHFSFSFTHECLDFPTKIERAVWLFGRDIKIIVLIREQLELIRSLYKESVRVGFPGSYNDFLSALYKFQDRNYFYDLRYDLAFNCLTNFCDIANIHFLAFEDYRNSSSEMVFTPDRKVKIVDDICRILNIEYIDVEFNHYNEAMSKGAILAKSELNKTFRHDLGNDLYSSAELHRQAAYFLTELEIMEAENIFFKDVITKRALLKKAMENPKSEGSMDLFECDTVLENRILSFYKVGNIQFSKITGLELPKSYY